MSYLQVICEQHRLVEQHLDKFAAPATEGGQGGGVVTKEVRQLRYTCVRASGGNAGAVRGGGVQEVLRTPRHPLGTITTNRFLPRQDLPTDPEALSALVAARFDSASTTGIIDLRHLGTPEALAGLPGLATMVYVADVRHNGLLSVPAPVLGLPQLVVLNASDNAIEEVAEGEGGRVPLVGCGGGAGGRMQGGGGRRWAYRRLWY